MEMVDVFKSIWIFFVELPAGVWAVIGALYTVMVPALVSVWVTRKTLVVQRGSLDVQRMSNSRSASTFIAEKRQRWIDDLRNDASEYLSLSLETAEAWRQFYSKCGDEYDKHFDYDPQNVVDTCDGWRVTFLSLNAARDSDHHQLYMRITLRLNNEEEAHQHLMKTLDALRTHMGELAAVALKGCYANQELLHSVEDTLNHAKDFTKIILKEEWQRLKREVADPDRLIREILSPSKSGV